MKTISEIKDEVALEKYDCHFKLAFACMDKNKMDYFMNEVAKRYAEEALKECHEKVFYPADKRVISTILNKLK